MRRCAPGRKRYTMNRNAKGAIAVGAATLLLLGGGGTFALWNNSATVSAGTVESGHLTIDTSATTDQWYDAASFNDDYADWLADPASAPGDPGHAAWLAAEPVITSVAYDGDKIANIADWPVAPGAELAFVSSNVAIAAEGSNLKFEVTATVLDDQGDPIANPIQGFTVTAGAVNFSSITPANGLVFGSGAWSIDPSVATGSVTAVGTVKVDVVFPDTIEDQDFFNQDLDLTNVAITLQQVI